MSNWDKFDKSIDVKILAAEVMEAAKGNRTNSKTVPHDDYEVEIVKLEATESKNGDPMVTIWFRITEGEYRGYHLFMNQVITQAFQIHIVNDLLKKIVEGNLDIEFKNYIQYENLLMDIFERISGDVGFILSYSENDRGFSTFDIKDAFALD